MKIKTGLIKGTECINIPISELLQGYGFWVFPYLGSREVLEIAIINDSILEFLKRYSFLEDINLYHLCLMGFRYNVQNGKFSDLNVRWHASELDYEDDCGEYEDFVFDIEFSENERKILIDNIIPI